MAQVRLLKLNSGILTQVADTDSIKAGASLSISDVIAGINTPSSGVIIYSDAGKFQIKQSDGSLLSGFSAGGDLSGNGTSQTVAKLQGITLLGSSPSDGYVLTYEASSNSIKYKIASGGFIAGGDLTGSSISQTVLKINGASVPTSGSLVTGNVLQVSGTNSLTYAPINLAGGSNYVSGLLPTSNQANQTLGGDVSGTTNNASVLNITGTGGVVNLASTAATLKWANNAVAPTLTQDIASGTGATLTIQAQNTTGSTGGALNLTSGTGTSTAGNLNLQTGGITIAQVLPNKFQTSKGIRKNITTITNNYTILTSDENIIITSNSSPLTMTLPLSPTTGDCYTIKDGVGNASINHVTIDGNGKNIDGAATYQIRINYASLSVIYNGAEWSIL